MRTNLQQDYRDRFSTDAYGMINSWKWPGLYYYHISYKGNRQILKYLLDWWKSETGKDLPIWVYSEKDVTIEELQYEL